MSISIELVVKPFPNDLQSEFEALITTNMGFKREQLSGMYISNYSVENKTRDEKERIAKEVLNDILAIAQQIANDRNKEITIIKLEVNSGLGTTVPPNYKGALHPNAYNETTSIENIIIKPLL